MSKEDDKNKEFQEEVAAGCMPGGEYLDDYALKTGVNASGQKVETSGRVYDGGTTSKPVQRPKN